MAHTLNTRSRKLARCAEMYAWAHWSNTHHFGAFQSCRNFLALLFFQRVDTLDEQQPGFQSLLARKGQAGGVQWPQTHDHVKQSNAPLRRLTALRQFLLAQTLQLLVL